MGPKKKAEGDKAKGEKIFKSQCTVCHSMTAHGTGPKLGGIFGRSTATAEGFTYS